VEVQKDGKTIALLPGISFLGEGLPPDENVFWLSCLKVENA